MNKKWYLMIAVLAIILLTTAYFVTTELISKRSEGISPTVALTNSVNTNQENEVVVNEIANTVENTVTNEVKTTNTTENSAADTNSVKTQNTTSTVNATQTNTVKSKTNTTAPSSNQTEQTKPVQQAKSAQSTPQEPVQQTAVSEPVVSQQTEQPKQDTETFSYNAGIEQQVINIINANPSQSMIQYKYSIISDSSIIGTAGFFTVDKNSSSVNTTIKNRVLNMLTYRSGVIKIYTRDYFKNGSYVWTECYIL